MQSLMHHCVGFFSSIFSRVDQSLKVPQTSSFLYNLLVTRVVQSHELPHFFFTVMRSLRYFFVLFLFLLE